MNEKIKDIINAGEGISTELKECKKELPKNIFETICAFLNRHGGNIILGVDDNKKIIGIDDVMVKKIKDNLVSLLNNPNKISPTTYFNIGEIKIEGKTILHFYVPESSQVHTTNGKIFDRNEDGDFDITGNTNLVSQMYLRKQKEYSENRIYPYVTMQHLRSDLIDRVRRIAVNRQPHHAWENLDNEQILKSAGLYQTNMQTNEKGFTLACVLLFGKDETILSVLPHHKTDAILRKVNLDRYDDRDDIRCNLIQSYDRLMSFIEKHLDDRFFLDGDVRIDVRNRLFREVIANILIHREYSNPFPSKLVISKEKVVAENGNRSVTNGKIDFDDFMPFPKNPIIAKIFKEIGWADELGSGVRNMKKYSEIYSGELPTLEDGDVFSTTIPLYKIADKTADKIADKTADKSHQKRILDYIEKYGVLRNDEQLQKMLNIKERRIRQILSDMVENDLIVAEGSNKNRSYKLKSK